MGLLRFLRSLFRESPSRRRIPDSPPAGGQRYPDDFAQSRFNCAAHECRRNASLLCAPGRDTGPHRTGRRLRVFAGNAPEGAHEPPRRHRGARLRCGAADPARTAPRRFPARRTAGLDLPLDRVAWTVEAIDHLPRDNTVLIFELDADKGDWEMLAAGLARLREKGFRVGIRVTDAADAECPLIARSTSC